MIRNRIDHIVGIAITASLNVACDEPGCSAEAPGTIGVASDHWAVSFATDKACAAGWLSIVELGARVRHYCPAHRKEANDGL